MQMYLHSKRCLAEPATQLSRLADFSCRQFGNNPSQKIVVSGLWCQGGVHNYNTYIVCVIIILLLLLTIIRMMINYGNLAAS